jgi:hypothetical protein
MLRYTYITEPMGSLDSVNEDLGVLDTSERSGSNTTYEVVNPFPNRLILAVLCRPLEFLEATRPSFSYVVQDTLCKPLPLPSGTVKGVEVRYAGWGEAEVFSQIQRFQGKNVGEGILSFGNDLDQLIYTKPFSVPGASTVVIYEKDKEGQWSTKTSRDPQKRHFTLPLVACGASWNEGGPLHSVAPVYGIVSGTDQFVTGLKLSTQESWHQKGIHEGYDTLWNNITYYFHETITDEEKLRLVGALEKGYATVRVTVEGESQTYQSCQILGGNNLQHPVKVVFERQDL